ncbi:kinetochore protein Nuf2-A-like [Amphiura filiformis]|uniref:kinetochore protein Nuf2-A-like n=1 Tax=Amphiura filiformis TaxID=82378 RepID=UPI003B20EB39
MANHYGFPIMSINDIIQFLCETFPDDQFAEDDFKNPQPHRTQQIYGFMLENTINVPMERFGQSQLQASQELMYPELHDDICPVINLSIAVSRLMGACQVDDFKIKDLLNPKPKRTIRMMSAIINFYRFTGERFETYNHIKQQQEEILQQHRSYKQRIDEMKARINQIKAERAEKDVAIAEMAERVDKLSGTMTGYQQEQATQQRDIQMLKMTTAEKTAKIEKLKLSSHNTKEAIDKLRPQIIQSPERIKADMARMHNAISAGKAAKDEKARRLQEIHGQKDRGSVLLEGSQQGVKYLANIMAELDKQKEMASEIEKIRDKRQGQTDVLHQLTAKEGHVNRQIESRQEKLAKMQIQHRVAVEGLKENIVTKESELTTYQKKEQKKCEGMQAVRDKISVVTQELLDKENEHSGEMQSLKDGYVHMLQKLDDYHAELAINWEQTDPRKILGTK